MRLISSTIALACWLVLTTSQSAFAAEIIYQAPADFLQEHLAGCQSKALWLKTESKTRIEAVTGKPFPGVRARYCTRDGKTAWVLDEIGKTEPITTGIVVDQGRVEQVRVLIFRETRGSEVHRDAFTRQYEQSALDEKNGLDRPIDGITGATLSVYAVNHQVKLALVLDELVRGGRANDD